MRVLRHLSLVLGLAAAAGPAPGQGYVVLEIHGVAGVTNVGGNSVALAGDVDGDGVPDAIVGAPTPFGGIGQAKIFSGATGALLRTFTGTTANDLFGWAVAGPGDLDGDGLSDVVVTAIHSSAGGVMTAGRATAFSGASGAVLWVRDGTSVFDSLGESVAGIGDVDGDGVGDVAVGVSFGDVGAMFDAGRVEILSGATGLPILTVSGTASSEFLGTSVAGVGDVTGDGIPDVLAGAPRADPGGITDAGRAILFSGANGATLFVFQGTSAADRLGTAVAGVGDVSGDGIPDLAVGAPQMTNSTAGYVRLHSGANGALLFTVNGAGVNEKFGSAVAGTGDLSGDGVPDLVVGAPGALGAIVNPGAGRVRAVSGAGGGLLYDVQGTAFGAMLGSAVAGLGDVDGNGAGDFIAGQPGGFGTAGLARIHSGSNGAVIFAFLGQDSGDQFGRAAALVGDVDGDGREDVLVGAPNIDAGQLTDSGRATLHSGASGATLLTIDGTSAMSRLGAAVAGLGDVNGDGVPDFAIGSPGEAMSSGRVRVISGANGTTLLLLAGSAGGDAFGTSVAGTGDLDGDGVPDLVAGAPQPTTPFSTGYARSHSGATGAPVATYFGVGSAARMGTSVAGIGDADGDGVADVAVGAPEPGAPPFVQPGEGYVRVHSGASGSLIRQIDGLFVGGQLGATVAPAGDLDGDGLADVLAGAPQFAFGGMSPVGAAAVYSSATGTILSLFIGQVSGERLGASVGGGKDLDGDGVADLVVGSPGTASFLGLARVVSGATGGLLATIPGAAPSEAFGVTPNPFGDVNGDGVPDLLLTAPLADPGGLVDAGRVRVVSLVGLPASAAPYGSGCAGTAGFVPAAATFGGDAAVGNAAFGISVARGRGGAPAVLFLGTLPDPLGLPILGCSLHLSGTIFPISAVLTLGGAAGVGGAGFRLLGVGVPPVSALAGAQVHLQWAILDPGSASAVLAASDALTVTVL